MASSQLFTYAALGLLPPSLPLVRPSSRLAADLRPPPLSLKQQPPLSPLDVAALAAFRWACQKHTDGVAAAPEGGFSGMIQELRDYQRTHTVDEQIECSSSIMETLAGPVPWLFKAIWSKTPWAPAILAWFTSVLLPFLVGEMALTQRAPGDTRAGGVQVTSCKVLEESGCSGLCLNMCKRPTEKMFAEKWGVPLYMQPNFETRECSLSFGVVPVPVEEDEAVPQGCLSSCPMQLQGHMKSQRCASGSIRMSAEEAIDGKAAAGALASSALLAEGVQYLGTALALAYAQERLGCSNPVETVSTLIEYVQGLGASGYGLFAVTMIGLQVMPVANAFLLTVTAGAIFGAIPGTLLVLMCSTVGASTAFVIARTFARDAVLSAAEGSPAFVAINDAFGKADFQTSLTLITLLRVSPAVPFVWGNYLFGLSPLPLTTFSLGTFVGCAPAVAVYVSAGQVGAEIAVNGAGTNPYLLGLGVAATIGAVSVAGNIASDALKEAGLEV